MPNTPINGIVTPASVFLDNTHLVDDVLAHSNLRDIVSFARSSECNATLARLYLQQRLKNIVKPFFDKPEPFMEMLRTCKTVISGSTALHYLLGTSTPWSPTDLDLYTPHSHMHQLITLMNNQGYHVVHQGRINNSLYMYSKISTVVSLSNGDRDIDVIVCKMFASLPPVFQFHSTAVMNFISPDRIFCAYPALTFRGLSMINPGPLYMGRRGRNTFNALQKYEDRGFRYIECAEAHQFKFSCKNLPRTLTDGHGMWVDFKTLPRVSVFSADVFARYGCLNVCWLLGGMVCDMEGGFVLPRVSVIEDAS